MLCILHIQFAFSQCREPNATEKKVVTNFIQVFDEHLKPTLTNDEWTIHESVDIRDGFDVAESISLPERPFDICSGKIYTVDLSRSNTSPATAAINDSVKILDQNINAINTQVFAELNKASTAAEVNALAKKQQPLIDKRHAWQYRQAELQSQLFMYMSTDINMPQLIIGSPNGGDVPSVCKKINITGTSVAYLLTYHDADFGTKYKIIVGLGKWSDNHTSYKLDDELYIPYRFAHHYLTDVIENITITISGGSLDEMMKLVHRVDWDKMNNAISHN
jgi:hypothetical protein